MNASQTTEPSGEASPSVDVQAGSAPAAEASVAATPHAGSGMLAYAAIAVFLAALAFGGWGAWQVLHPPAGRGDAADHERRIDALQQRIATLEQSDQVSRSANADLQKTLAERDEEIAGLQADVAFYERFVGAPGQRRGLAVHALELRTRTPGVWQFTATLTQNLTRGEENAGTLSLQVEGSRNGQLERLDWPVLRQQAEADGLPYAFKYFQRLEGDILLPDGFQPVRVIARVVPRGGKPVEQSFAWADAASQHSGT